MLRPPKPLQFNRRFEDGFRACAYTNHSHEVYFGAVSYEYLAASSLAPNRRKGQAV